MGVGAGDAIERIVVRRGSEGDHAQGCGVAAVAKREIEREKERECVCVCVEVGVGMSDVIDRGVVRRGEGRK